MLSLDEGLFLCKMNNVQVQLLKRENLMQAVFETIFDVVYLTTVTVLGIRMIQGHKGRMQYLLFGIMAVVLGAGDAFHLVPRAVALWTTGLDSYAVPLGIGKLITSNTMTVFYVLLYYVWRARYEVKDQRTLTVLVWLLAVVRVILNFMAQNDWLSANPSIIWGIYRNIPFALLGAIVVVLFYLSAKAHDDQAFKWMWLTIVISFACYLPVVLWTDVFPAIGALMIPKTCAYVWTVWIGYSAMKKNL